MTANLYYLETTLLSIIIDYSNTSNLVHMKNVNLNVINPEIQLW